MKRTEAPDLPDNDTKGLFFPGWLITRPDIKWEDQKVLALILVLQESPGNPYPGRAFASQSTMGEMLGMSRKAVNLSIARLSKEDKGRKTGRGTQREKTFYKYRLIDKHIIQKGRKRLTTYSASIDKDTPMWWMKEFYNDRAGFEDIRTKQSHDFTPKANTVSFKRLRKSS